MRSLGVTALAVVLSASALVAQNDVRWDTGLRAAPKPVLIASPVGAKTSASEARLAAGAIVGTISDARSLAPLAAVQVYIPSLRIGTLTGTNGRYVLREVPPGTHEIQVMRVGYRTAQRRLSIQDGATVRADFQLTEEALALDEIVVTGTAGGAQRRSIGHVVERVDAARVLEQTPSRSLEELVGQRTAGVMVLPNTGQVGTGSAIRIRGSSSLSLSNNPLIYVDGVRVDNNAEAGPARGGGRLRSTNVSRLNDLNPADIESIEVIKGPAAASLYGTEASAGVVHIITKRGVTGPLTLEFAVRQGVTWLPNPEEKFGYTFGWNAKTASLDSVNILQHERETTGNTIFRTGALRSYYSSLRGGTEVIRYYASLDVDDNEGFLPTNWERRFRARINLDLVPNERWSVSGSLGSVRGKTRFGQAAHSFSPNELVVWAHPSLLNTPTRGFRYATPEAVDAIETYQNIDRFTGVMEVRHTPWGWFRQKFTGGLDVGYSKNSQLFRRTAEGEINFFGGFGSGYKDVELSSNSYLTLDYSASVTRDLGRRLRSITSVGLQYYRKQVETSRAIGQDFPVPFVTTVAAASVTSGAEDFLENKTLGAFAQQQVEWNNRLFVTAALRGDDNSAFGADYSAAIYPKFSATWVVSEEPFWRFESVNTFRFRTAWGQAGQQPDVFDALRLYEPTAGPGNAPVLTPVTYGNPGLKPEVGQEIELGFDAGLFDDRISFNVTHYRKRIKDAIVQEPISPSLGFPGNRIVNLGEVRNWGWEAELNGAAISRPGFNWELGLSVATTKSRVESLGGLTLQNQREGFPVNSIFWWRVVSAEFDAAGKLVNVQCDGGQANGNQPMPCNKAPQVFFGQPDPTWSGSASTNVRLGARLSFYANADFRGGHTILDNDIAASHTTFSNTRIANVRDPDALFVANRTVVPRNGLAAYDAGFARLRELSATFSVPESWSARLVSSRASVTAAWRNVALLWQAQKEVWGQKIVDPERLAAGQGQTGVQGLLPPSSQFLTTIRVAF